MGRPPSAQTTGKSFSNGTGSTSGDTTITTTATAKVAVITDLEPGAFPTSAQV